VKRPVDFLAEGLFPENIKAALRMLKQDARVHPIVYFVVRQVLLGVLREWDEQNDMLEAGRYESMSEKIGVPLVRVFEARDEDEVWRALTDVVIGFSVLEEEGRR
jgi:hypothetical protein